MKSVINAINENVINENENLEFNLGAKKSVQSTKYTHAVSYMPCLTSVHGEEGADRGHLFPPNVCTAF